MLFSCYPGVWAMHCLASGCMSSWLPRTAQTFPKRFKVAELLGALAALSSMRLKLSPATLGVLMEQATRGLKYATHEDLANALAALHKAPRFVQQVCPDVCAPALLRTSQRRVAGGGAGLANVIRPMSSVNVANMIGATSGTASYSMIRGMGRDPLKITRQV